MARRDPPPPFVMTGLPRSGTTYLSAVLYGPPRVVTISDPGGVWKRFYREHGVDPRILEVFEDFRRRILAGEPVPVLEGTRGFEGRGRVDTWNQQKELRPVAVEPDFHLGMKNPEVFLAHLPVFLDAGLRCLVSLRHPLPILASWVARKRRSGAPLKGFANGESICFRAESGDAVDRRIALHNHLCERILAVRSHPNVRLVRWEDWFTRPGLIDEVCDFVGIPSPGRLRPEPKHPKPVDLDVDEQERILRGCTIAAELGYPLAGDRLAPPPDLEPAP